MKGTPSVQQSLEHHCKVKMGETTHDKNISLVTARCVGSCGLAPVAVFDNNVVGKLTGDAAVHRVKEWEMIAEEVKT